MNEKDFMINEETLEKYLGNNEVVTIPESVTKIKFYAFKDNVKIKKVILHEKIALIGGEAFCGCKSLKEIIIPDNTESLNIGIKAFKDCINLQHLNLPANTRFELSAFRNCKSMADKDGFVVYKGFVQNASEDYLSPKNEEILFGYYGTDSKVIVPNNVKRIIDRVFYGCKTVTEIVLPQSLECIYADAFNGCSKLEAINIPESIKIIERNVFTNCESLKSIIIPNTIQEFYVDEQFKGDKSLEKVKLPKIQSIGYSMFKNCISLTSIIIPDSVSSLGFHAFDGCSSLKTITIPNNFKDITCNAFIGCTGLAEVNLPDTIVEICKEAFYGCTGLKNINLPKKLRFVGDDAFSGCCNIENIEFVKMVKSINSRAIQSLAIDLDSLIIDFCYTNALRESGIDSIGEELNTTIKNIIKKYIYDISDGKTLNPMEVISQIQKTMKLMATEQFSFGKIQLLLNTTVKYIYISQFKSFVGPFGFKECHCPIDKDVLTTLSEMTNNGSLVKSKWNGELKKRGIHRANISTMIKNIKPDEITTEEYLLCQDMISDYVASDKGIKVAIDFSYI